VGPGVETVSHSLILTAAPESETAALADLRRGIACEGSGAVRLTEERLAPGVVRVDLPLPFAEVAARLRARSPIFIRHIQPVQREVAIGLTPEDLDRLAGAAVELASGLSPGQTFSVQTRLLPEDRQDFSPPYGRFEVNERLAAALQVATGAPLDVRAPVQVLSALVTPSVGCLGLSRATENLSSWAGGAMRFAREEGQVSRSEFKLLEALAAFDLSLPATGRALDLGAAPGGWTRVLRRAGLEVTAVDPGDLDPRLSADAGIRHVRALAQELRCRPGEFEVLVNDMRMDGRDSARLMLDLAPCLRPGGLGIMTVKLPHAKPGQVAHQAIALLHQRYRILNARQLFHNRSEITVALERRGQGWE
jgi:23S rRNA (cytidine2498-2'-O)-methyltransferase